MLLKLIGATLVCGSCSLIGIYYSLTESYRIADLNEMKKAVIILKSEIEYAMNPLPEALKNISSRINAGIGCFFGLLADKLTGRHEQDFLTLWNCTLREALKHTHLTEQDFDGIEQLGRTLGYLDKNLQLNSIDLLIDYIDSTTERLYASSVKNKRMYRSMGIITGFIVSIILL